MADNADHVSGQVDAYLHDLLSAGEARRVQRHCDSCPDCAAALAAARKRLQALRSLLPAEASESLIQRTEQRLNESPPRRSLRRRVALAAVAAVVLVVGGTAALHYHYLSLAPTPYDLQIFGQSRLFPDTDASLRVFVTDHETGAVLAGVPVEIDLASKKDGSTVALARFQTDALGTASPVFHIPYRDDGEGELCVRARPNGELEEFRRTVTLKRSCQVQVSTDRPVYQPGQTLLFRSLALRQPDLRPADGEKASFTISDPKGNKVFHETRLTSRFGIASAEMPLADEITEGTYRIDCQVGDTTGTNTVEVKHYALPKFKVAVTTDRPFFKPGDSMLVQVRASYFFGKPVTDGSVALDVRPAGEPNQAKQYQSPMNGAGIAEFRLTAPAVAGKSADGHDTELQFGVQVTDSAGQRQTASLSRPVTDHTFQIELMPEGGKLVPGLENIVYLMTRYPDGSPARAELEVSTIPGRLNTDELGLASFRITPPQCRDVTLGVKSRDVSGHTDERDIKLACAPDGPDFLLRTDKAVYSGGDTMKLSAVGIGIKPVYVDLLKDGQIVWTGSIDMAATGETTVALPPSLFGAVELSAYRPGRVDVLQRASRAVFIRQARTLNVTAESDRPEYRPGQQARVSFRMRDNAGRPLAGALSLAAVDEAVFAISGQATTQPFLSSEEQNLLQPVQSFYPWTPDTPADDPADRQNRLNQALFARTADRSLSDARATLLRQLLPYLENDTRVLSVLERPDWEQLAGPDRFSPEVLALLRSVAPRQALTASTYPEKMKQVEAKRRAGLELVEALWGIHVFILVVALIGVFLYLISKHSSLIEVIVVILILIILYGLLLPATQQVREASARTHALNELKQIELALDNYQQANGKPLWETADTGTGSPSAPRVRQWFPETLLWRPELITDDEGRASIELPLADSITDWRLTASAVAADGRLGNTQAKVRVFQPFFVDVNPPPTLTRGDEVAFPVVAYNYLNKPQRVTLKLENADWFDRVDEQTKQLELTANEVRSVSFRLKVRGVGRHEVQVTATGDGGADAVRRTLEVVPEGQRAERVVNGTLQHAAEVDLAVPDDAVDGSVKAVVRLYPSSFSQLVDGLDGIFRLPYGCFEQTSSVTYPNLLALDYLRRMKHADPKLEQKAREYVQLGYQRLLTFEVAGGGFDWFGHPPANRVLTAYGLAEFTDMARVRDVDPALIERTRAWLLKCRRSDGSWEPVGHAMAGGPTKHEAEQADLATTAYIATAVFANGQAAADAPLTRDYLLRQPAPVIRSPYTLALVCNALLAMDPNGGSAAPYVSRLREIRHTSPNGQFCWWSIEGNAHTLFYGAGPAADVEATALACLALIRNGKDPEATRAALTWITSQRDANGTWYSTQATVQALRALVEGTGRPLGGDGARHIEIALDGKPVRQVDIPADQSDVMKLIDLSPLVDKRKHHLTLTRRSDAGADFQVALIYHVPANNLKESAGLALRLNYDRSELRTGERLAATASVVNTQTAASPMVMVEVPVPPGFAVAGEDFEALVQSSKIAKFQQTPRSVLLYLRSLNPGQTVELPYHLRGTMPGSVTAPSAVAYEYYNPARRTQTAPGRLTVSAAR